jgi:hypothetical protein
MIRDTLRDMIRGADPEDFTPSGQPNKSSLDAKLGFVTERHEVENAFARCFRRTTKTRARAAARTTAAARRPDAPAERDDHPGHASAGQGRQGQ